MPSPSRKPAGSLHRNLRYLIGQTAGSVPIGEPIFFPLLEGETPQVARGRIYGLLAGWNATKRFKWSCKAIPEGVLTTKTGEWPPPLV